MAYLVRRFLAPMLVRPEPDPAYLIARSEILVKVYWVLLFVGIVIFGFGVYRRTQKAKLTMERIAEGKLNPAAAVISEPTSSFNSISKSFVRGVKVKFAPITLEKEVAVAEIPQETLPIFEIVGGTKVSFAQFEDGTNGYHFLGTSQATSESIVGQLKNLQTGTESPYRRIWYTHMPDGLHFEGIAFRYSYLVHGKCAVSCENEVFLRQSQP